MSWLGRLETEAARDRARAVRAFYDGATIGRRGASIRRRMGDANAVTRASLTRLRLGSHDLLRNNPHASRAVEAIVSNSVGSGIAPQFLRPSGGREVTELMAKLDRLVGRTGFRVRALERAEDIEELADECLETTDADADGRRTYHGLQDTAFRGMVASGETLVRRRFRRPEDGLACPIQFQLLEADFLDTAKEGTTRDGGRIIQGVEFDPIGRRRAYWLFPEHPGSRFATGASRAVPASEIAHIFRAEREGQVRGIPWLAPVMLRLSDWADYEDAQLVRQKIAACFVGFWKEPMPFGPPTSAETDPDGRTIDSFEPGMWERLPPGTEVEFGKPPEVEGIGEYSGISLRAIAAGMGISFEAFTGDLRGVNFSSGKMGRLEMQRNIDRWRSLTFIPQFCDRVTGWFLEAASLAGHDTERVVVRHIPPRREMIDPPREIRAERDAIRSGQKTLTQVIREGGRDPVEHLTELASDNALLDTLGVVVDSDPRRRTAAGQPVDGEAPLRPERDESLTDRVVDLLERVEERLLMSNGRRW